MNNFDSREIIRQFLATIIGAGIKPRDYGFEPLLDGQLHRFAIDGDKGSAKSGGYAVYTDKRPAGWAKDFRQDITVRWKYDLSDSERREYAQQQNQQQNNPEAKANAEKERKEAEKKKAEEQRLQIEKQQAALRMAIAEYNNADLSGVFTHPYLAERLNDLDIIIPENGKNGILRAQYTLKYCIATLPGGKCERGQLLVPMVDVLTDSLATLIRVLPYKNKEGRFDKPYYPGLSPKGSAFILAPNPIEEADCLYVAEGFLTALAVFILTSERSYKGSNFPVLCVGGSNNLLHVCSALRKRYPDKQIIIMSDNDKGTEIKTGKNPGIEAAENCVRAGVADYHKPPPVDTNTNYDWYDFLRELYTNRKKGY